MPLSAEDLRFNPPSFDQAVLARAALDLFGLRAEPEPLVGERDQNMLLTTAEGEKFVLKVSGPLEDPLVTELQTCALLHLEKTSPEIPVPRIIPNRQGLPADILVGDDGAEHVIRLLDHVPGITYDDASDVALEDLRAIGAFQGRVCHALASFRHPAADHFMPWDISNGLIDSEELWAGASIDTHEIAGPLRAKLAERTLPAMKKLRSQIIHGDAHVGNLLRPNATSHRVCGLIDFGDMVEAPMAIDLAVTAASFISVNEDALAVVVALARGFNEVVPLSEDEIGLLYDLVLARHVLSALLFDFQLATHSATDEVPADREDLFDCMRRWLRVDPAELAEQIHAALPPASV
ncbi:MAG: phosphotransferase [Deltaproteobacteria bacterium]|nr:phosphotransferase [Deltaproteobacteria bacterium]MBW2725834.1 phosphotransferase [Deltaproteobacteria bacterium]